MAALLADGEAHNFAMFGERGAVNDQVHLGMLLGALPEADGVVDEIDAGAAFGDLIGADDFVEMDADFGSGVGHGKASDGGVFFQAPPVAFVGKGLAAADAESGENAPAAD